MWPHRPIGRPNWTKSAIFAFWSKKLAKYGTYLILYNSAGNGRNIKIVVGMCALDLEDTFKYLKCYNTCNRSKFMTKNIYHARHFLKKKFSKIKLREIFFSCKSFGKNSKKKFFQPENLINFFFKK